MRRLLGLVAPLALASLLLGCGDGGPSAGPQGDRAEIEALTERFARIVERQDAEAFCAILAPNDVQRLAERRGDGSEECLKVWGNGRNPLFGADAPDFSLESVVLEGTYAKAMLGSGGELGFAKEDGRWYVHLGPGRGQGA
jgi:hypothetical protein